MKDVFNLVVRHGSEEPVTFEREHESAGYTQAGDWVVVLPGGRSSKVEAVIHDIVDGTCYSRLHGVLYDNAESFVSDVQFLRDQGWNEVAA